MYPSKSDINARKRPTIPNEIGLKLAEFVLYVSNYKLESCIQQNPIPSKQYLAISQHYNLYTFNTAQEHSLMCHSVNN